jgi:hypothetical protein
VPIMASAHAAWAILTDAHLLSLQLVMVIGEPSSSYISTQVRHGFGV